MKKYLFVKIVALLLFLFRSFLYIYLEHLEKEDIENGSNQREFQQAFLSIVFSVLYYYIFSKNLLDI